MSDERSRRRARLSTRSMWVAGYKMSTSQNPVHRIALTWGELGSGAHHSLVFFRKRDCLEAIRATGATHVEPVRVVISAEGGGNAQE